MAQANLQGSNINLVKQHNLQVILLSLLYEPVLSRSQLAKHTNLSNTTITNLIAELINQGLSRRKSADDVEQGELRPVGRPRTNICLEPNARFVVGIHIGVGIFRVAITNLRAEIVHNHMQNFDTTSPAAEVLEQIVTSVEARSRKWCRARQNSWGWSRCIRPGRFLHRSQPTGPQPGLARRSFARISAKRTSPAGHCRQQCAQYGHR